MITTTLKFDQGTYMVVFAGQNGPLDGHGGGTSGSGAVCVAFYQGQEMDVQIGMDAGRGEDYVAYYGGGKTIVKTNFALPGDYRGNYTAIASGGAGNSGAVDDYHRNAKAMDGTFAG